MKVKVILRAPKSQIPLYMTLNDAKFGNEEVATSLNVVESDEVVRWVNTTNEKSPTNLQIAPQKQLVISDDLARSITNSISDIIKNKNKANNSMENRVRDLKSNSILSSERHKYNVSHVKDALLVKKMVPEFPIKNDNDNVKANSNEAITVEKNPEIGKIEKLLSQDLDKCSSPNSGTMGVSVGSKYNGKELKSNIRKKYFKSSNLKGNKSDYEYNKKFRSNEDFPEYYHDLFPQFNDSSEEKDVDDSPKDSDFDQFRNSEMISKKIQDEIDHASKIESIQCEIVKTFKNLTLSPCLCKSQESPNNPYDRNKVIIQKSLFINELREKVPLKNNYVSPKNDSRNMYLLIHGSGKEAESAVLSKDLKSNTVCNLTDKLSSIDQAKISKSPKSPNPKNISHELNSDRKFEHVFDNNYKETNHIHFEGQNKCKSQNQSKSGAQDENIGKYDHTNDYLDKDETKVKNEQKSQKEDLDPKSQLFQALSRLSLELSNTNLALDQCLKEKEDVISSMEGVLIKGLQDKLDNLELLYKKIQIKQDQDELNEDLNQVENLKKDFQSTYYQHKSQNDNEASIFFSEHEHGFEQNNHDSHEETFNKNNSGKLPNTDLPLLRDEMLSQEEEQTNFVTRKPPIQKIVQSYNESFKFQPLSRIESKRSISVPVHENQLSNFHCEKNTKSIEEIPSLCELQDKNYRNKNLSSSIGSFSNINSNNLITSKSPLSKVGLKPNSSSERLSPNIEEGSRGRTKFQGNHHSRAATRDFVAENKSNVMLNAAKSSSSLFQNNPNKKNTKLIKKKSPNGKANQNSLNNDDNNGKVNAINHKYHLNQNGVNNFDSGNEIYPSLEVGGPIARMNGTCGGFVPCFPGTYLNMHYDPHFGNFPGNNYNRSNYQYMNNHSQFPQYQQPNYQKMNGYIGANGIVDNNTPRCPYWCNLICRT
ncbi:hypothetical protein CHM_7g1510 [Cryptosporidium hominis]